MFQFHLKESKEEKSGVLFILNSDKLCLNLLIMRSEMTTLFSCDTQLAISLVFMCNNWSWRGGQIDVFFFFFGLRRNSLMFFCYVHIHIWPLSWLPLAVIISHKVCCWVKVTERNPRIKNKMDVLYTYMQKAKKDTSTLRKSY